MIPKLKNTLDNIIPDFKKQYEKYETLDNMSFEEYLETLDGMREYVRYIGTACINDMAYDYENFRPTPIGVFEYGFSEMHEILKDSPSMLKAFRKAIFTAYKDLVLDDRARYARIFSNMQFFDFETVNFVRRLQRWCERFCGIPPAAPASDFFSDDFIFAQNCGHLFSQNHEPLFPQNYAY